MDHRFDTPGHVRLRVENAAGVVVVTSHDAPVTEVSVTALSADAEEAVQRARVEHRPRDGRHEVSVAVPDRGGRLFGLRSHRVRVEVRLPHAADVSVSCASADIEVSGRFGSGELRSESGDVHADTFSGPVRIRTASGGVRLAAAADDLRVDSASGDQQIGQVAGRAQLRSASGDVGVGRAEAELSVQTASGDARVEVALAGLSAASASGDVHASCVREGQVTVRTASGNVVIGVARGSEVRVDAASMSGDMESEIDLDGEGTGAGSGPLVTVTVQTVSGDVRLVRAGEAGQSAA
jgi:DUF4097 and DUF4098 domain-containing protein YvlB